MGMMLGNLEKDVEYVRQILRGYAGGRPCRTKKGSHDNVARGIV